MGDATLEFPTRFHNLQGELIGERKKNFSKLLREPAFKSNEQQLYVTLQNLQPKNYLEELFKIDALIYFKRTDELLKMLRNSTNEIFIKKIIKPQWFIEETFKNVSAEEFVNDFLPCMSYSVRMKLLKKVSLVWDETKMDDLFDNLFKHYGLAVAKTIFHRCSPKKIRIILEEHEIKLNPNQVKCIFDKNTDLFTAYLQHRNKISNSIYNEEKVINYVALKDSKLLLQLEGSKVITFSNLGRRKSKEVFSHAKFQIAKNIEKYINLLNKAVVVRKLGNEFPNIYQSMFPNKIDEINVYNICNQLLQLYPKHKRWQLFVNTFTSKFSNRNIADLYLEIHDISKFKPDRVSIQNWAEAHYKSTNSERFLRYYDPSKSIVMIKDKINVTSDMNRRECLVILLIETCAESKDFVALEDVLKYICMRHRNEEPYFRLRILSAVENSFKVEELNENHWKYLNEQLKLLRIQKDFTNYTCQMFVKYYIQYVFKHAKPFRDVLLQFINDVVDSHHNFVLNFKNPELESQILINLIEIFPNVINKNTKEYDKYYTLLFTYIIDFNIQNAKFAINLNNFPYLISYIETILTKSGKLTKRECSVLEHILLYNVTFPPIAIPIEETKVLEIISILSLPPQDYGFPMKVYKAMLLKKNRSHLENNAMKFYFEKIVKIFAHKSVIDWFLINEPSTLVPYFEDILKNNLETTCVIDNKHLKYLKCYSHIGLDKKCCEFSTTQLNNIANTKDYKIKKVVNILQLLLSTDEFVTLINKYFLPKSIKLDLEDEELSKFYKVQCDILEKFHRVNEPSKMLPVIMQFSQGDYLKFSVPALYSTFYRTPEQQLNVYINTLSGRAISVKKHALFLTCEVMGQDLVIKMLKDAKSSNASGQKHVFSSILKYFLKNPSQELFNLVIENLNSINENDSENLEHLQNVHIPHKYKPLYIENCWQFYESLEKLGINYKQYLKNILSSIAKTPEISTYFSSDFVNRVVNGYFKTLDEELNCDEFVLSVLKYRLSERTSNFDLVFQILINFPTKKIHKFFSVFYDKNIEKTNNNFVEIFAQYWNKTFSVIDTFKENVSLKLLCSYHSSTTLEMYAQSIIIYMDQLITEFGYHVFNIFKSVLKCALEKENEKLNKYLLCLNILKLKCSSDTSILVLGILDQSYYEHTEDISIVHKEIMDILENVDDRAVRIYYKYYSISNEKDCNSV